jgi:hypothetical protein
MQQSQQLHQDLVTTSFENEYENGLRVQAESTVTVVSDKFV